MKKLLVANRGEIAVRILRAAQAMNLPTVAVYSEADAHSPHVAMADEAVALRGNAPSESYLDAAQILRAAASTGADAIHPGYGFLSERADFVEACNEAGITFVGPPAAAMRQLGSKTDAKALAVREGVPIVPGMFDPRASADELKQAAEAIGYPVMLKAAAGGGGRGMRIVRTPDEFEDEMATASDEALKAFGDGTMMVEKLVLRPRHIEVQILADQHGTIAPLFERECSIQRRHQKLIEEAPASDGNDLPWPAMREAAVRLVRAAGYVGAGTIEFIYDETSREFYFLEVNARLQVEHPVTELVTGLDLVQWQLRIADGAALDIAPTLLAGDRSALNGCAIEARVVAEDPARNFAPSIGKITTWLLPEDAGVRVDTGFARGLQVSRFYDSLLAKVIVAAPTRGEAIDRLRAALADFHVIGVRTNIAYLLEVLDHPAFRAGDFDTEFLGREFADWSPPAPPRELADFLLVENETGTSDSIRSPWAIRDRFRNVRG